MPRFPLCKIKKALAYANARKFSYYSYKYIRPFHLHHSPVVKGILPLNRPYVKIKGGCGEARRLGAGGSK